MRTKRSLGAVGAILVIASASTAALADNKPSSSSTIGPSTPPDKAACVGAVDKAQASRAGRKLLESRASYVTCSHEACPDVIRDDCSKGLREVDEALPTLVLSASVDGHDATDAKVVLDGDRLTAGLDGRAIPVDPGPHIVRFERPSSNVVEVKVVAREGEKNRLVVGTFVLPRSSKDVRGEGQPFPYVPAIFAGTGVLALGGALVRHLTMISDADDLRMECGNNCPQSKRDELSDKLVLRNVLLGVGVGALAVAAVTYVVGLKR